MAFDINSLLNPTQSYGGLPPKMAQAALISMYNQLQTNPQNALAINSQMAEMFGPDVTKQVFDSVAPQLQNTTVATQSGATPPVNQPMSQLLDQQQANSANNIVNNPNIVSPTPSSTFGAIDQGGANSIGKNTIYGNAAADTERILQEADFQRQQQLNTLNDQNSARTKYLSDLSGLLQQQQAQQLTQALPGVYEDLNTRGLLRSSALGNELGEQQAALAADTSNKLAQQGLAYNDLYTSGIGNISNDYLGARNSALQRRFSLEDLDTNIKMSKELGFALQPQQQSANGKSAGSTAMALAPAALGIGGQLGAAYLSRPVNSSGQSNNSYFCTQLKKLGILTEKEVKEIYKKVVPVLKYHLEDYSRYNRLAPLFINLNSNYDWKSLKQYLYNDVIKQQTCEEAFQIYKLKCEELFKELEVTKDN